MSKQAMGKHNVSIIEYPSGKFGFVGSLPESLTVTITNKAGQVVQISRIVNTQEQAEQILAHAD